MMSHDDRVIDQVRDTLEKIKVGRVADKMAKLERLRRFNYCDEDEYNKKAYKILLPLNKKIKQAFDLCDSIEDDVLRDKVYLFMETTFHVDERDWDKAFQTWIECFGGWEEVESCSYLYQFMYYFASRSLEEYLDTHDDFWLVSEKKHG